MPNASTHIPVKEEHIRSRTPSVAPLISTSDRVRETCEIRAVSDDLQWNVMGSIQEAFWPPSGTEDVSGRAPYIKYGVSITIRCLRVATATVVALVSWTFVIANVLFSRKSRSAYRSVTALANAPQSIPDVVWSTWSRSA